MSKLNIFICGLTLLSSSVVAHSAPYQPVTSLSEGTSSSQAKAKPVFKIGQPYTIKGIEYNPHIDTAYDEIGVASWYGTMFQGALTANGEVFDKNLVTAASAVLPLPSVVEITNLNNGKSLLVRVNDRGPYKNGRIIDVSERAAELLGFKEAGTAHVRVRFLPKLTQKIASLMPNYDPQVWSSEKLSQPVKVTPVLPRSNAAPGSQDNLITVNNNEGAKQSAAKIDPEQIANDDESLNAPPRNPLSSSHLLPISLEEPNTVTEYIPRGVFVQVGSFLSKENSSFNVQKEVQKLSRIGVVVLQSITVEDKNFLRVRVGPYGSIEDASRIKTKLLKMGYRTPRIVVEE